MNEIVVTFDTDWAPDYVIDHAAKYLLKEKIKSTWFITHDSPAIRRLMNHCDLIEVGLHPNFLQGTTQGIKPMDIIANLRTVAPMAVAIRTHGMVYSAYFARLFADLGFKIDSSVYLGGMPRIKPFITKYSCGSKITRMPYFWTDDGELMKDVVEENPNYPPGLKIFCFHPIHFMLNTSTWSQYLKFKIAYSEAQTMDVIDKFRQAKEFGIKDYFMRVICGEQREFRTLSEINKEVLQWFPNTH
jgi:hypothetical protein